MRTVIWFSAAAHRRRPARGQPGGGEHGARLGQVGHLAPGCRTGAPYPLQTARRRFVRGITGTMQPSDSSPFPRRLHLPDSPSRPGTAKAVAGKVRSPRFRRVPFMRDWVSDHGRAPAPRIAAPDMLPSTIATVLAAAAYFLSGRNRPPQTMAVYASPQSAPSTTQHALPGGRYPLPGPDSRRLRLAHRKDELNRHAE